jgi:hypothetical protein
VSTAPKIEPSGNTVTEVSPGVWLLTFPTPEDCVASKCHHLVAPLVEASKKGKLVVLAHLAPQQRSVDMSMPTFWLEAFTRKGAKVAAIGVVTTAAAVKVAVKGFHLAMKTVGFPIEALTFPDVSTATAWGKTVAVPRER